MAQVMQIYQMDAMNFHFVAHPNAWVVHRPHPPSSGYNHTFTGEAYSLKHKPTDHLWKMERIAKVGAPPPVPAVGKKYAIVTSGPEAMQERLTAYSTDLWKMERMN